jgi:ATP-binding protein involved in chromosome partitioning
VVTLAVAAEGEDREAIRASAVEALSSLELAKVEVHFTMPPSGGDAAPESPQQPARGPSAPIELPGVKDIIAVGAGKGGVGKSTVAVHLAIGLERLGKTVGLMDADVYGPSIATMLGFEGQPAAPAGPDRILPFNAGGVRAMSIANFVQQQAALIWRGPMTHGVVRQFLGDVEWGELDYLIVDLPPGTGDVPLSLAQSVGVSGAVVVSTPQPVALNDAVRAARMYEQLGVSVLGLVENMSYLACDQCGKEHDIFGRGGVGEACGRLGYDFLGGIPMASTIRRNTDRAEAAKNFEAEGPVADAVADVVTNVVSAVAKRREQDPPPAPVQMGPH